LTGPIRGNRLPSEVKLPIVRAIDRARVSGFTLKRACEVILLSPRRLRRWARGRDLGSLSEDDLADRPPIARTHPHALMGTEREEVKAAAREDERAHLRLEFPRFGGHLSALTRKFANVSVRQATALSAASFSASRSMSLARSERVNFHSNGLAVCW